MNELPFRELDAQLTDAERAVGPTVRAAVDAPPMRRTFAEDLGRQLDDTMAVRTPSTSPLAALIHERTLWPVRAGLAAAAAVAVVFGIGVLAPRFTPQVDATELMNAVQNAA